MSSSKPTAAANVLFLGAGASRPLGKMLMWEFVDHLRNDPDISRSALFDDLISKERDLEYLLEELQEVERLGHLKYLLTDEQGSAYPPSQINPLRTERSFRDLAASAATLRSKIEEHVFLKYRHFENQRLVTHIIKPLFDKLADAQSRPLAVFTTNYDPAVEIFCAADDRYHCVNGFELDERNKQYWWDRTVFETAENPFGRRLVYLFKLHGSVDWVRSDDRIVKGVPIFAGEDKMHRNVLIYPAKRKVALDDPFFTAYQYLRSCLEVAKYCLVVGYSFRDYDALTQIRAAARVNPNLSMQVFDPNSEQIVRKLGQYGINAKPIRGMLQGDGALPASISPSRN